MSLPVNVEWCFLVIIFFLTCPASFGYKLLSLKYAVGVKRNVCRAILTADEREINAKKFKKSISNEGH